MGARVAPVEPARNLARAAPLAPAGFWKRFAASLIDSLAIGVVNMPLSYGLRFAFGISAVVKPGDMNGHFIKAEALLMLVSLVLSCTYYAYFYTQKGWSPGKRVMGLRVLNVTDGTRLTVGQSVGRELGKILSGILFCIGFLMAAFRKDKRALHDLMAGSQVVQEQKAG